MMLSHDRQALGGDSLKVILRDVLVGAFQWFDEHDIVVRRGLLGIYSLPA